MKIYDISLSLSANTVRWVTAQPFELIERKRMSRGDTNNSSSMHTSVHAGMWMRRFILCPAAPRSNHCRWIFSWVRRGCARSTQRTKLPPAI